MKERKRKFCSWCGKPTVMKEIMIADSPILEFMEEKINEYGRDKIWGENSDWITQNLDPDFEAELLVYDQMLSTATKKTVCVNCLSEDDKLYNKYYGEEDDGEIVFDADF